MLTIPDTTTAPEATEPADSDFARAAERSLMDEAAEVEGSAGVKPGAAASGGDPEGPTRDEAKPAETPAADLAATEELKHVPEEYRDHLKGAPKELLAWLKSQVEGSMKDADYRKKTATAADLRREAERMLADGRTKIDFADTIIGDEEAMSLLRDLRARRSGSAGARPAETKKFDWSTATSDEIEAHLAERDAAMRAAAKEEALAEIRGEREQERAALTERQRMALTAKSEFVDSGEYTPAEVDAVVDVIEESGGTLTSENIVEKLRRLLPKREVKVAAKPAVPGAAGARPTASVLSRASGASAPVTAPASVREGRAPKDLEEEVAEAKWFAEQRRLKRTGSRTS